MKRRRLLSDDRGVATIEFALWCSMFFVLIIVALDFGMVRIYQMRLGAAVEQGAIIAFNQRTSLSTATGESIKTYVASASGLPGMSATSVYLDCNSKTLNSGCVSAGRIFRCLTINGSTYEFSAPQAQGSACTGGATAGYYLTIIARYVYHPVIVPNSWLNNKTISAKTVLRLQ
ncbi:TadE/TadG family type IV pilus assembly protein [Sphingomonas sp. ID0503]|uniref:TadE/TadG family type IV pilus assembly protein n=1 Tax=Sphingomonas sp. ID0503 TaxID=3399691 RepID=UPI003AFA03EC